ncbi:MAG: hypothetical protein RLZ91_1758, partial [Bacteroidota bacterium]
QALQIIVDREMSGKQCQMHIANNAMFFEWVHVNS